jgi:uncharacterized membrane protein YkoI
MDVLTRGRDGCGRPLPHSSYATSRDTTRAPQAKITITQAREILKAHPGAITDEELEHEHGGSGFRYSFDIKIGPITQEVGVDAVTGNMPKIRRKARTPTDRVSRRDPVL